jgi:DNA-binding MarR family transcriptional regulator
MDREVDARLSAEELQDWYAFAFLLLRLPAALETHMQREVGISHFEYLVLAGLSMMPRHTQRMRDLADNTASTVSRLSNVVSRLEKRGWVRREPDPDDGRSTFAVLTATGLATVEAAAPRHTAEVRRLVFDPLTKAQHRQLGTIATRILRAVVPDGPRVEDCIPTPHQHRQTPEIEEPVHG